MGLDFQGEMPSRPWSIWAWRSSESAGTGADGSGSHPLDGRRRPDSCQKGSGRRSVGGEGGGALRCKGRGKGGHGIEGVSLAS